MVKSNLKAILDSRGLSIRKVAGDLDYRFETVRRMYNDDMKHYPEELIDKLCAYLDVSVGDLITYEKSTEG